MYCEFPDPPYWLNAASPCAGAGEGGADIGAFGVGCGVTSLDEPEFAPARGIVHTAVPNPFSSQTSIAVEGAVGDRVKIKIYDVKGRALDQLNRKSHYGGKQVFVWNSGNTNSGVYYYQVTDGTRTGVGRLVKVR
jgi:hypothetical protein